MADETPSGRRTGQPRSNQPAPAPNRLREPRRLLFSIVTLLLPVAFFGAAEGVLRLTGYGADYPLFKPIPGYEEYLYPAEDVARRYFPAANTLPGIPFDSFPAQKDSSAFRIFVQGGSTAAGFPFYFGGSFADMLEQRLLQTFPGRKIEVVNTAMAAVNSFTLVDFVDEIIEQRPDLVIIYAGHNEYYGAMGVGSTISAGSSPALTRLFLRIDHFRVVQALRSLIARIAGIGRTSPADEPASGTLMEQVVGNQSIRYGSGEYNRGVAQFRSNLRRILSKYRRAGVPVMVGTVSSNLRGHRPFVSGLLASTDEDAWTALMSEATDALSRRDTVAALAALTRAIESDSTGASSFWSRARLHDAAGRHAAALRDYVSAKDRDQLRFRAPEQMNVVIREEATRAGATVVESYDRMANAALDGIIGDDLMTEHLHPNIEGYFQIASSMYETIRSEGLIGDWSRHVSDDVARDELLITEVDSLVGVIRVRQLTGSWPFQPRGRIVPLQVPDSSANPIEGLAYRLFERDINRQDALDRLRELYLRQGDYHEALKSVLAIIQRYPFAHQPYLSAASIMVEQRRLPEALDYVEASLERLETGLALELKGSVLLAMGRNADAIPVLQRAIEMNPQSANALYNLAGGFALTGRREEAREMVRRVLAIRPDHPGAVQLGRSLGMDL